MSGHSPTGIVVARLMRRETRMRDRMCDLEGIAVVVVEVGEGCWDVSKVFSFLVLIEMLGTY